MRTRRSLRFAALAATVALVAAGCGGKKDSSSSSSGASGNSGTAGSAAKELKAAPGFDPATNTIKVGIITPLTGPVAVIGKPLTNGNEVWFKHVNDQGGIAGKYKIETQQLDSQYVPQNAVQAYNSSKNDVALFAQLLGTPPTKAVLPLLKADNILASPASLDAAWVHDPNLLPVGGPYQIQMINAASYLLEEGGAKGKTFCAMAQDDAYGEAGLQGLQFAEKQLDGFALTSTAKFTAGNQDFTAQLQQLRDAKCEVNFLIATPSDTGKALGQAASLGYNPQWVGQSPTWIGAFAASPLKDYLAQHFLLAAEGTEWGDTSVKGMAEMLDDQKKYAPDQGPDIYFVFGYYEAKSVTQILEKAVELGDLSRAGLQKAVAKVGKLDFDGLSGTYDYGNGPADRNPPRVTTIFKVNPAKPGGLEKVKYNFQSDAAKAFKFAAG